MSEQQTRVTRLRCRAFRNHQQLSLETDSSFVALCGKNGSGKTSVLEALSMFAPGRGFFNAAPDQQLCRFDEARVWALHCTLSGAAGQHELMTGYDAQHTSRIIKADGEILPNQHCLRDYVYFIRFVPADAHLFTEGASARRKYLDRMVSGFDTQHSARLQAYEHVMRERRRLLMMPRPDALWLDSLESRMADSSVAIAYARLDAISRLRYGCAQVDAIFPQASISVDGDAERLLESGSSALDAEQALRDMLCAARQQDAANGRCSAGAHKSQFVVTYIEKNIEAALASTGEQKALLLTLMLAQIHAHTKWYGNTPILLLDDITAHLDMPRRRALFAILRDAGMQVFATSTDATHFDGVEACHILTLD